jgi:hypothetical protein
MIIIVARCLLRYTPRFTEKTENNFQKQFQKNLEKNQKKTKKKIPKKIPIYFSQIIWGRPAKSYGGGGLGPLVWEEVENKHYIDVFK